MYVHYGATSICQLPICNFFTQHVTYLYGETPLVNLWTPVHSFTLIIQSIANTVLISFTANKHRFPHYTSNPLFSARPVRLTTSLYRWGQSILVVLCAGSTLLLTPVVRPANVSGINLQKTHFLLLVDSTLVSYWGKDLLLYSSHLPLGVSQHAITSIKNFWRRCRGGRSFLQGESLTLNLFTLFLLCLVDFVLSCLLLYIKNTKN